MDKDIMCGVAGIVAPRAELYKVHLQRMLKALEHRGPDASGMLQFDGCLLGHTRLSIVDLHTGGQPMVSGINPVALTFNGEIYGFKAIKAGLCYPFKTSSDTELILALYEKFGVDLLTQLPGIFAFGVWDDVRKQLFCARDRFGEKPFFYAYGPNGEFVFASEIKAIIASGLVRPRLDRGVLAHYLKRLYVPTDKTIYENVYSLPPAHSLMFRDGRVIENRYWQMPEPQARVGIEEATEQFVGLLQASVRKQLVADVEVGAFLSGGLDSSTIVALAGGMTPRLKTISFGFGSEINELPYAREIAKKYETDHVELVDNDVQLVDLVQQMAHVYDEPFADSSNIPTFLICRHAAKELKVVLTGDGADELLAGYSNWYRPLHWLAGATERDKLLWGVGRLVASAMSRIGVRTPGFLREFVAWPPLHKYGSVADAHAALHTYFDDIALAELGLTAYVPPPPELYGGLDDALRMDLSDYMPGDILTKVDRASMANSLELRAPFLDVDLATFLIGLPASLKFSSDSDKILLRRAFAGKWTESVRSRRKQGFGAPVKAWLNREGMKSFVHESLLGSQRKIREHFDGKVLKSIALESSYRTWIMLVLSVWMEAHEFD